MSNSSCTYSLGAPSDWLRNSSLTDDAKACAIAVSNNCGSNDQIISDCCTSAAQSQNLTKFPYRWTFAGAKVCSLPDTASNETYQGYQDCLLNAVDRQGEFRCNDLSTVRDDANCASQDSAPAPLAAAPIGKQICTATALAGTSSTLERCCGHAPVSFGGGCWQYCIGSANDNLSACIESGLSSLGNGSHQTISCWQSKESSTSQSAAMLLSETPLWSTLGLIAVVAYTVGLR